jgi:arsenite methyltransferase
MTGTAAPGPKLDQDSEELARDYEQVSRERQLQSGKRLVQALHLAVGERVLDVGCGTGLLAEHAASIVGAAGSVVGIDPLPLRIALAEAKARPNLAFRVASAYDLSFIADESFDVVMLNAVLHWLPDKTGPMREFARVLRPGGRIGIGGSAKDQAWALREAWRQVMARQPFAAHPLPPADIVARVDLHELAALLEAAGFAVTSVELYDSSFVHPSADAAVRYAEASSFGNTLGHLPRELRAAARMAIVRELHSVAAPDGTIRQDGRRMVMVAVKRNKLDSGPQVR